jgi:hypothetical protein
MDKHGRAQRNAVPVRAHGQALVFEAGERSPPDGLLEWLNRVSYREKGDRSQKAQNDRKADGLVLERLEFGILCKDGIFSREYSKQIRVADPFKQKDARFNFDYGRRNLRLNLINPASKGSSAYTSILAIRGASVRLIVASDFEDEHSVTLFLLYPPAFEEVTTEAEYDEDGARRQYTGRQRRPALDEKHQEVSAHTSRTIRFVFDSDAQSGDFQDLLVAIGCPPAKLVQMETDRRRLYDKKARHALTKWLGTLSSRAVAFQLSRLFCNNLLTPAEILEIRPDVEAALEAKGPFHTSDILHQYVEELMRMEDTWLDGILKDSTVTFQKDSTYLEQKRSYMQVFREFVERGMHRVDWRENYNSPVMQCLHVTMTPTSMILDGPYPDQSNRPLR